MSFVSFVVQFSPLSPLLRGRVAEPERGRARARHPRTALSPLLPPPFFGSPLQSVHALPSLLFSLLLTFYFFVVAFHIVLLNRALEKDPLRLDTLFHKIRRFFYQCRCRICLKGYSSKKIHLAVILDDQQPTNQEIPTLKFLLPLI